MRTGRSTLEAFFLFAMGLFGLVFGSFANVVIWRFPRGESLSSPGSHCPACDTPIKWYDNVPAFGWLALKGKCRECGATISARYPAVELLSCGLWILAGVLYGPTTRGLFAAFFFYMLLILLFVDLDTMRLPNALVGFAGAVGLAGVVLSQLMGVGAVPLVDGPRGVLGEPLVWAAVGMISASGVAFLVALAYSWVRHTEGFGMGDVKLLAVIGVYLGPYALMTLFLGSAAGALYGLVAARRSGGSLRHRFPFGPFLAGAAVVVAAVGVSVWMWYLGLLG